MPRRWTLRTTKSDPARRQPSPRPASAHRTHRRQTERQEQILLADRYRGDIVRRRQSRDLIQKLAGNPRTQRFTWICWVRFLVSLGRTSLQERSDDFVA